MLVIQVIRERFFSQNKTHKLRLFCCFLCCFFGLWIFLRYLCIFFSAFWSLFCNTYVFFLLPLSLFPPTKTHLIYFQSFPPPSLFMKMWFTTYENLEVPYGVNLHNAPRNEPYKGICIDLERLYCGSELAVTLARDTKETVYNPCIKATLAYVVFFFSLSYFFPFF